MARYPDAVWKRLPGDEPKITPRTVIFHTMIGTLPGTDTYFRSGRSGGVESHFGVGGPWEGASFDGLVWQWRDTEEQADANFRANAFAVSIETSDGGNATRPWTRAQLEALIALGRWLADVHRIPRRICPAWDQGGFGWHTMWGAPSNWTPVAKTCPGATRIAQLKQVVLPAIFAPEGELTMADAADIRADIAALRKDLTVFGTTGLEETVEDFATRQRVLQKSLDEFKESVSARLDAISARVTAIESDVDRLVEAGPGGGGGSVPLQLSPHEIAQLVIDTGWEGDDQRVAIAVCLAESAGDSGVMGRSNAGESVGNRDHGLWQISGRWHGDKLQDHPAWRTPATNAALAFRIFTDAGGWTPWAAFNSGTYRTYLPDADIGLAAPFPVTS